MTFTTRTALIALTFFATATMAPAQEDGVQDFGASGTASMFGVTTTIEPDEGPEVPRDMTALIEALTDQEQPDIAWESISSVTEVELVRLTQMEGDAGAAGLSDWLGNAGPDLVELRASVEEVPALTAALNESGLAVDTVIGAFGSAAGTVALVIDDRR